MKSKPSLGLQLFPQLPSSSEFHDHRSLACSSTRNHITVLYTAHAGVCDTSELQALAILWHARLQMEEKYNVSGLSNLRTPSLRLQLHSPSGLSLRKSLQRFLQKRRNRIQAATPY